MTTYNHLDSEPKKYFFHKAYEYQAVDCGVLISVVAVGAGWQQHCTLRSGQQRDSDVRLKSKYFYPQGRLIHVQAFGGMEHCLLNFSLSV